MPKAERKDAMVPFSDEISNRYPRLITMTGGFSGGVRWAKAVAAAAPTSRIAESKLEIRLRVFCDFISLPNRRGTACRPL